MISEKRSVVRQIKECEKYIAELKTHCEKTMFSRKYSWRAKHPFKVMSYVNAMTWRMYDMSCAAIALLKQNKIIPALCLVRACWENMVATYELSEFVSDCCKKQLIESNSDDTLMRLLFSNRYDKYNRYVGEEYFEQFKEYKAKNILTIVQKFEKPYCLFWSSVQPRVIIISCFYYDVELFNRLVYYVYRKNKREYC